MAAGLLLAALPVAARCAPPAQPRLMLWAWERNEDLRFLDPGRTGVAFLAKTLLLENGKVYERPRLQPLRVSSSTYLMAAVRVEAPKPYGPLSPQQASSAARKIAAVSRLRGVMAVQIDFDAVLSQRKFYRDLIIRVRKELAPGVKFSITALVSWCGGEEWLAGLPVDEAVPMLFRMGPDAPTIRAAYAGGVRPRQALCAGSAGFSLDEPFLPLGGENKTVYLFNTQAWTPELLENAEERIKP